MVHGYRNLQNWDKWLAHQFLGNSLIKEEKALLSRLLDRHYGKHVSLIGVPSQYEFLEATHLPYHSLITPLSPVEKSHRYIENDLHELPILTGSVDLVVLPHTLELIDNPRQLFTEACRIVKPEGLIVILGFNPYSMWGLRRFAWRQNLIHSRKIKGWLHLADFALEQQQYLLYRPPTKHSLLYEKLHFIEYIGSRCFPMFGGVYTLMARAKVIPLTPIRMKWKQQLSGIRISTTISGHIAR